MEERTKSLIGFFLFIGLILIMGVGGYFYTFHKVNKDDVTESNKLKITMKNKMDKNRDFIYYTQEEVISEKLKISYKTPKINLTGVGINSINDLLRAENEALKSNVKYLTDEDINEEELEIDEANIVDDIYSATVRSYEDYKYNQYISLVMTDYKYDIINGFNDYNKVKAYVFDVNENKMLSNLDVLNIYNVSLDDVKKLIKNNILDNKNTEDEINIDEVMENYSKDDLYTVYINENNKLVVKFIVNLDGMNYNDSIIINE